MQANLLTSESAIFQGELSEIQITTTTGEMTILPHHEAYAAILVAGEIRFKPRTGATREATIGGGIVEIRDNRLRLLATIASDATKTQTIAASLEAAIGRANNLDQAIRDKQELGRATAVVDRSSSSLGVATMKRRRPRS